MRPDCAVCDGRHTIDTLVWLQLGAAQVDPVPLCRVHHAMAEGALYELRKIQSAPVILNVAAVTTGGGAGQEP